MMRWLAIGAVGLLAALTLAFPGSARALLNLDIGFDPEVACPGDQVQFFFSLENVGDEAEMVEISVTISFDDQEFGPFTGSFELPAGEEITKELQFMVPPPTPPGVLTISVTASDSDGTVEDSASLEIQDCNGRAGSSKPLINTVERLLRSQLGVR